MRSFRAPFLGLIAVLFISCGGGDAGLSDAESMAQSITIYRDTYGVISTN